MSTENNNTMNLDQIMESTRYPADQRSRIYKNIVSRYADKLLSKHGGARGAGGDRCTLTVSIEEGERIIADLLRAKRRPRDGGWLYCSIRWLSFTSASRRTYRVIKVGQSGRSVRARLNDYRGSATVSNNIWCVRVPGSAADRREAENRLLQYMRESHIPFHGTNEEFLVDTEYSLDELVEELSNRFGYSDPDSGTEETD